MPLIFPRRLRFDGAHPVRDLRRHKDLGVFSDSFTAEVLPHAAWMIKVGK